MTIYSFLYTHSLLITITIFTFSVGTRRYSFYSGLVLASTEGIGLLAFFALFCPYSLLVLYSFFNCPLLVLYLFFTHPLLGPYSFSTHSLLALYLFFTCDYLFSTSPLLVLYLLSPCSLLTLKVYSTH